jgi:hypothetical protein
MSSLPPPSAPESGVRAGSVPPMMLALPRGARMARVAAGCRAAALDFINRVSVRPDKAVLADWLRGAYRRHVVPVASMRTRRIDSSGVMPGALAKLLTHARLEVLTALEIARDPVEGVAFGYSALASGHLYRARDAEGNEGWVPVAQPRMRLTDRVLSLVAADHLLHSADYESTLFECMRCEQWVFDAERVEGRVCAAHASDVRELMPGASRRALAG